MIKYYIRRMIKKLKPFAAFLMLLLSACNFNSTYLNRENDRDDAKKIGDKYFELLKKSDYVATFKLFSDNFWTVTPKPKMSEIYQSISKKLGKLQSITLDQWETRVLKGTNSSSEYILYYLNHYEKFDAKETLRLVKEGDDIKIIAFNINSDGLLK